MELYLPSQQSTQKTHLTWNEFVVDIIDRMMPTLFGRCYKSREGSPRIALIVPLGAVRALQNEKTENAQRRYLRP